MVGLNRDQPALYKEEAISEIATISKIQLPRLPQLPIIATTFCIFQILENHNLISPWKYWKVKVKLVYYSNYDNYYN